MQTYAELVESRRSSTIKGGAIQRRDAFSDLAAAFRSDSGGLPSIVGADRPYKQHPWVHSCVSAIARNVAQVPLVLIDERTEETLSPDHPASVLFNKPNPLMSRYDLMYATEVFLNLGGMCLWIPVPSLNDSNVVELWPFSKDHFEIKMNGNLFQGFKVKWKGFKDEFTLDEVLFFRYFNPYDPVRGMAPLEAAQLAIDQDWWANKYNEAFFRNFAELGVVITAPEGTNLTVDQVTMLRETFEQRHQGFDRARKAAVLSGGFTVTELGMTKRDMQFIDQLKMSRDQIMSVFRVPPAEIMNFEMVSSRVENAGAQRRLFGEEVIAPELMMIEGKINGWLSRLNFEQWAGVKATFDTSEVSILQESRAELIAQAKDLATIGWPINAINEKLGLGFEKVAWGDEWFIQAGMVPASMLVDGSGADEPEPETDSAGNKIVKKLKRKIILTPEELSAIIKVSRESETPPQIISSATPQLPAAEPSPDNAPIAAAAAPQPAPRLSDDDIQRGRKLQRRLFDLRNSLLREADGIGLVEWDSARAHLRSALGSSAAADNLIGTIRRSVADSSKDEIKRLFSYLRAQAQRIAQAARSEEEQPTPTFMVEDIDRDAVWNAMVSFTGPIERKYAKRLHGYFSKFSEEYLKAFREQSAAFDGESIRAAGEPEMDFLSKDDELKKLSSASIAEACLGGGKCSRLLPSRSARAKTTHVPMSKEIRARAQDAQDSVAKIVGGESTPDNHAVDVLVHKNAVEVKTLVSQANDKITMHPDSLQRKLSFVKKNKLNGMTVVIDLRGADPEYYFRKGFGSFRLGTMKKITKQQLEQLLKA